MSDPTHRMTLEEAQQQPQQPLVSYYDGGSDLSTVWIRLRLAPQGPTESQPGAPAEPRLQWLRLVPLWAESLSVHDPLRRDAQGQIAPWDAPLSHEPHTVHTLGIAAGDEVRDLWIRFKPAGNVYLSLEVLSAKEVLQRRAWDALVQGIAIGLLVLLLIVASAIWWIDDTGIGRAFFLKQVTGLAMALHSVDVMALLGLAAGASLEGRVWWGDDGWADALRALNLLVSLWFLIKVLELFRAARWALRMERLLLALFAANALLLLSGDEVLFRLIGSHLHALAFLLILSTGWACPFNPPARPGRPGRAIRFCMQLGLGLLMASSWIGVFVSGFFKSVEPSLLALIVPLPIAGAVGVLIAISLRRIRVDSLQRSQKQRQAELDAQALRFERAERERQQEFMAMLTHELKAPLSTLGMVIGTPSASVTMQQHAQRALASMRQVIDHCAKSVELDDDAPPLDAVASSLQAELELRRDGCAEPARIQLEPAPGCPPVRVDQRVLAVILNNLLQNALQYSPPASAVSVRLSRETHPEGAVQRVHVSNQTLPGGLPDAERLFQKYYRGEATPRVSGSGLELHLSRRLARRLGGELSYQGDAQRVTFTLTLPE